MSLVQFELSGAKYVRQFLFKPMSYFRIPLISSYIQCTYEIWHATSYDADAGN